MWFTYRRGFPALPTTTIESDVGWGCMIRTGQMMLARALITVYAGSGYIPNVEAEQAPHSVYRQVSRTPPWRHLCPDL